MLPVVPAPVFELLFGLADVSVSTLLPFEPAPVSELLFEPADVPVSPVLPFEPSDVPPLFEPANVSVLPVLPSELADGPALFEPVPVPVLPVLPSEPADVPVLSLVPVELAPGSELLFESALVPALRLELAAESGTIPMKVPLALYPALGGATYGDVASGPGSLGL